MLIRKIDKAKWLNGDTPREPPSADAITNDLRTSKNTLSVWRINDEKELEEAVLAIVSGQDHLETIDVVMLDDDFFVKCSIATETTKGQTPVADLVDTHRDVCQLDFWTIGMVAEHIVENIKKNKLKRFTKAKLKQIIQNAIAKKRIELSDLTEDIRKKMG